MGDRHLRETGVQQRSRLTCRRYTTRSIDAVALSCTCTFEEVTRFLTFLTGGGRSAVAVAISAAFLLLAACGDGSSDSSSTPTSPGSSGTRNTAESGTARVTDVMTGLDHPWDVAIDRAGNIVTGERSGRIMMRHSDGRVAQVQADTSGVDAKGEAGFMGLALARDFEQTRSVYTCFASTAGDVRVVRWTAAPDWSSMRQVQNVVTGMKLEETKNTRKAAS